MKVNLLEETVKALEEHQLSITSIKYMANAEGTVPVATFVTAATNFDYENVSDQWMVDPTLIACGATWWLARVKYNGVERWWYHKKPCRPEVQSPDFRIGIKRSEDQTTVF